MPLSFEHFGVYVISLMDSLVFLVGIVFMVLMVAKILVVCMILLLCILIKVLMFFYHFMVLIFPLILTV